MTGPLFPGANLGRPTPGGACPVGLPLGSPRGDAEGVASNESGRIAGTNTPRSSSSPVRVGRAVGVARRISARTRARLARELSKRDLVTLETIGAHRYLSTRQITALVFTGHASTESAARTTRRVLARLERDGLIRSLGRRVGGFRAGSDARIWQLAPAGARILAPEHGRQWRTHEPSQRFLDHTLAISDIHIVLRQAVDQQHAKHVRVEIEPESWRRFTGLGGQNRLVRPDLSAVIHGQDKEGAFTDRWFIEADMGSESTPTLLNKCRLYMDYYRCGIEQHDTGSFPQVLWVFHGPRADERAHTLQRRILRSPSLEPRLFVCCVVEQLEGALWGTTTEHNNERKEDT